MQSRITVGNKTAYSLTTHFYMLAIERLWMSTCECITAGGDKQYRYTVPLAPKFLCTL